jgi:hypothetical protein
VNLLGVSAFPHGARRSQLDLIPEDSAALMQAAKSAGLKLSKKKSGFLIQGEDRPGAIAEIASKLADAKINITSVQAFCAGSGRYGGMLWVKPPDMRKAAKVLCVEVATTPGLHRNSPRAFESEPHCSRPSALNRRAMLKPPGGDDGRVREGRKNQRHHSG